MKKTIALVLVLVSLVSVSFAGSTFDLSGLSYDELVSLKDQINLAMWNSQEWQEVEVPKGVYVIGEDIPVGKWTIKAADGISAFVCWGDVLDDAGTDLSYDGKICEYAGIKSVNYRYYEKGDTTEVTWDLKEGQYFIVDDGIALFIPYSGKPSLGFK